jgi:hypothetical protein
MFPLTFRGPAVDTCKMDRSKIVRLASVFLAASFLLIACAKTPDATVEQTNHQTDPVAMIQAASGKVLDAGAMHLTFEMKISVLGQTIMGTGEGEVSLKELEQHLSFHLGGIQGMPGDLEMEEILDGHVLYLRSSALQQVPGLTTDWISMDLNRIVPGFESLTSMGTGQSDPSAAFGYLRGVKDAQLVGSEEIGGVQTTHYSGTLDLDDAAKRLPARLQAQYRAAIQKLKGALSSVTMPFDVWIDGDGRLRRMSYRIEASDGAQPFGGFSMETTVDVTAYTDHITLQLPAKDDVTDATDLT